MRLATLLISSLFVLPLVAPTVAHADVPPDADKYMACDGLAVDAACQVSTIDEFYTGTCQNLPCDSDPQMTCLTCVNAEAVTTSGRHGGRERRRHGGRERRHGGRERAATAGETSVGQMTTAGETGGGGSTGDGNTGDDKGGCACRSDRNNSLGGGLLMLLGAVLLRRRRRQHSLGALLLAAPAQSRGALTLLTATHSARSAGPPVASPLSAAARSTSASIPRRCPFGSSPRAPAASSRTAE